MTAEAIANVVADLRSGRVRQLHFDDELMPWRETFYENARKTTHHTMGGIVVDATAVYFDLLAHPNREVALYEDHPRITPPYGLLTVAYENEHGNVMVMPGICHDWAPNERHAWWDSDVESHTIDWPRVRWTYDTFVYLGGRGGDGIRNGTVGPLHCWRYAIYEDGSPADMRWVQLMPEEKYPMRNWDMAHLVQLGCLSFLNAVNVRAVEPSRPRAERRRIERTGVEVKTLLVFPSAKLARTARPGDAIGVPLSSVRGHFAHYGDCCPGAHEPRGLAFGKLTGMFWVPDHARGSAEYGEIVKDYQLANPDVPRGTSSASETS